MRVTTQEGPLWLSNNSIKAIQALQSPDAGCEILTDVDNVYIVTENFETLLNQVENDGVSRCVSDSFCPARGSWTLET